MDAAPSNHCTSSDVSNSSNSVTILKDFIELSLQDEELLSTLKDLQQNEIRENINVSNLIQRYFCSDTL